MMDNTQRKPTFTPGPWKWWTSCSWRRLKTSGRNEKTVCEPYVARDGHPGLIITEADMALIAASPELYEALHEILNYSGGANNALEDEYVMERANAALSRARGEDNGDS